MKVLVACEFSGIVREAFRKRGHDAWSCDLLPTEIESQYHFQRDIFDVIPLGWDMMIAHPPCTYLTNAGVRHLYDHVFSRRGNKTKVSGSKRWVELFGAAKFFNALKSANIEKICIENPIPHKYAKDLIGKYSQLIQPWQFGHGETKATCLWLKNLPKLKPTNIVLGREARIHRMPPSKERGKLRSITYQGIANAMAEQWAMNAGEGE
jgi:hypothetical protein